LLGVVAEGVVMAVMGVFSGAVIGYGLTKLATRFFPALEVPSALPTAVSVLVLMTATIVGAMFPAERAASVNVNEALRSE